MKIITYATSLLTLIGASMLTGCVVTAGGGVEREGTLIVDWTVDQEYDASNCTAFDADGITFDFRDERNNRLIDSYDALCEDFELAIDLPEGRYAVEATMYDFDGRAITNTLVYDRVLVTSRDTTELDIDFDSSDIIH